ncbi:hypothetical protein ANCDUO_01706 [Ancylostoma duodenale]|uniref:Uncharacterized protein n=1 Tax=Ancylostoma duodenale TaxID=51022 RepID=A0A0C2H8L5_9BILA|nr:hypothetical protein ANCDUO_01706 [Ancylostoma duodenale]
MDNNGYNNFLLGKDGDIVFSKNNVCVHDVGAEDEIDNIIHTPGYLTIHCQQDEQIGTTLVLQWLPNSTLHKNPSRYTLFFINIIDETSTNCLAFEVCHLAVK